jgi:peptide/nickel transport system substrate-binding protein
MNNSYWSRLTSERIRRRRVLATSGGMALGAAFLAACGGGSSNNGSGGTQASNSVISQPVDTSKDAKRGGTILDWVGSDSASLEIVSPLAGGAGNAVASKVYSTLVREMPGYLKPSEGKLAGDIAESWEMSPDNLQITLKLRPGVKFHNKAPVNGRALDIDDVVFSWNRYAAKGTLRSFTANSVNPDAPIVSVTASDPRILVVKLKEPLVYALGFLGSFGTYSGNVLMVPKETDTTFDIRYDMLGTGPFMLSKYAPSEGWTLKRHPDYFDQDAVQVDGVELPILPEYATVLAQFKAGNIHYFENGSGGLRSEDLLAVKNAEPRLQVFSEDLFILDTDSLSFGWLPQGKSQFQDERVRQAISMAQDRDLWIDTFHDVTKLRAQGLPMETKWSSHLTADAGTWWLDPQSKDFGANAKYFQHDPAEAKKLLSAAGFPNGLTVNSYYPQTGANSQNARYIQVSDNMCADAGIKVTGVHSDYASQFIPTYRDAQGQYEGWAYVSQAGSTLRLLSPVAALAASYWSKGGTTFKGFSASGQNDKSGDPQLNSLIEKARIEPDTQRRMSMTFDIQRYLAKAMWGVPFPGGATAYTMAWPGLSNFGVYRILNRGTQMHPFGYHKVWLDQTKPPFSKT